jgi:hypothetical protein
MKSREKRKKRHTIEEHGKILGYPYVVAVMDLGHRCGYVGVDSSHPLYGHPYGKPSPALPKTLMGDDEEIGKRGIIPLFCMNHEDDFFSPDVFMNVHGGITYSAGRHYPMRMTRGKKTIWWFGFDCAHCDDAPDIDLIPDPFLKAHYGMTMTMMGGVVRTREYVHDECVNLAAQLACLDPRTKRVR